MESPIKVKFTAEIAVLVATAMIFASAVRRSQAQSTTPARLSFDAASIKRNASGSQGLKVLIDRPGGHPSAENATLRFLISVAYKLPWLPGQSQATLVGGPGWMDTEHFDIQAEVDGNPSTEEKQQMLQSLLADRFQLTMHHETRQLPAFALVLDKGAKPGAQLLPHSQDVKCFDRLGPAPPPPTSNSSEPPPVPCDSFAVVQGPFSSWKIAGANVTLEGLAKILGYWQGIDRAVVDRTGLAGTFDLRLEYTPQIAGSDPDALAPPPIFEAVKQQLGLRMESTRAPVDVLVIDHVAQPSEN